MKCFKVLISCVITFTLFYGCGLSRNEISQTVKSSYQSFLDTDLRTRMLKCQVLEVEVLKQDAHNYQGLAKVKSYYTPAGRTVELMILVDGKKVSWKIPPGRSLY